MWKKRKKTLFKKIEGHFKFKLCYCSVDHAVLKLLGSSNSCLSLPSSICSASIIFFWGKTDTYFVHFESETILQFRNTCFLFPFILFVPHTFQNPSSAPTSPLALLWPRLCVYVFDLVSVLLDLLVDLGTFSLVDFHDPILFSFFYHLVLLYWQWLLLDIFHLPVFKVCLGISQSSILVSLFWGTFYTEWCFSWILVTFAF